MMSDNIFSFKVPRRWFFAPPPPPKKGIARGATFDPVVVIFPISFRDGESASAVTLITGVLLYDFHAFELITHKHVI